MKGITKDQAATRSNLVTRLRAQEGRLFSAVAEFNRIQQEAWEKLVDEIEGYNSLVDEAKELTTEIASDLENYIDEKSDKWRDSPNGEALSDLLSAWQEIEPEILDLECPEALDVSDVEGDPLSESLENTPEKAGEL